MKILGIDPGKTTGIAVFDDKKFTIGHEVTGYSEVEELIMRFRPGVVVMENFLINTRRPSSASHPLKMIGVVEYLCKKNDIELVIQSPSVLSKMLEKAKGYHTSPHVRSASAHVEYYIRRVENAKHNARKR